jgi:hypothetical protein
MKNETLDKKYEILRKLNELDHKARIMSMLE